MSGYITDKRGRKRKSCSLQSTNGFRAEVVKYCIVDCEGDKYKALQNPKYKHVDRRRLGDWIRKGKPDPVAYWREKSKSVEGGRRKRAKSSLAGNSSSFVLHFGTQLAPLR